MRSEKEMMDLILDIANKDDRIRGAYLNGSRTNPNAPKDIFQDYDFVYIVTETASFIRDEGWIDIFGERLYMQLPEKMDRLMGHESDFDNCYGYLLQLADGNRVDFHLQTLTYSINDMLKDRLCIVLLDKDNALPKLPAATDKDHWVVQPSETEYLCCCNEFWWSLNNVGKGLWRGEIPYVMDMLNQLMRPELMKMIAWYVGTKNNFSCSIGKSGKYLCKYLSQEEMARLLRTYPDGKTDAIWSCVFEMCGMFDEIAGETGDKLGFVYNRKEAYNSRLYLDCVYELPADAEEIYLVRRMRENDVDEIAKIWLAANMATHSYIPESYWKGNYESVKQRLKETEVYVYEDDKGIQGFAGITKGYLEGIFVRSKMRAKGIGHALMAVCKSKYFKMSLHVYCKNIRAVNFYLREGFKISKKQVAADTNQAEYEMVWRKD